MLIYEILVLNLVSSPGTGSTPFLNQKPKKKKNKISLKKYYKFIELNELFFV